MAAEIAENMSQRWRMLFRRPVVVGPADASIDGRIKAAFEAEVRVLDEAGTERSLRANLSKRQGRVTAVNARREAAKRSEDWLASS